ncbi:winged helix-turn-helix transcriptional regulator [Couchioplanes caeruleus]|uniref:HxlR family transcriptional regulator n=2 Tax=Couchioplanes caeruleus TaxID=56438 RepID=A0A1K0GP38_9ACTN|nr:helix-turn-helix domain-containing protein [Couchioplanes caeruleus]OJF12868.1 HxlR family transcriptional regulator [Couchioplanes caeruleus subsp. caeruleus]ROP27955.1 HxlR family transcriptional regulator [Couchioplanes caeruleus]
MATRRTYGSYNDGCASAHALDLIGERWALVVVRELILGPKRFGDLQRDVLGIGPGVLSRRLQELEESGIVVRRTLPRPADVTVYDLTEWGRELEDINAALSRWAVRSARLPIEADMSPDTLVLAMRAHARPAPAGEPTRTVGLGLSDSRTDGHEPVEYLATISPNGTTVAKQPIPHDVDARVRATTLAWKAVVIGGAPITSGAAVAVAGDTAAVHALVEATTLQAPAGQPGRESRQPARPPRTPQA